uniref:Solute carrier family 46 member 3 n=1 Tax=Steinernema glaseri TaxID=37863 RepID=A0A1I7ZB05_9BILA
MDRFYILNDVWAIPIGCSETSPKAASMNTLKFVLANVGMEPALFLYMLSTFLKYPVFQSLLYEKSCFERYTDVDCTNVSHVFADIKLQGDANYMYLLSSVCLTVPSIVVALVLGAGRAQIGGGTRGAQGGTRDPMSDVWSTKMPMLIPFVGLVFCDINYIVQCTYMEYNINWLLLSDLIFGFAGGFTAIIGTIFSYSTKTTSAEFRSERMSALEGSIGLGGTIGYAISGSLRELVGYANIFLIQAFLHALGFAYILYFARDVVSCPNEGLEENALEPADPTVVSKMKDSLRETVLGIQEMFRKLGSGRLRLVLSLTLIALGVELFVFSGISDIQFSYFRYKLSWSDKQFGWFSGLGYACTTLMVFTLYPFFHYKRHVSDVVLTMAGVLSKIIYCVLLAFAFSDWMVYAVVVIFSLNRFVSTGMRAICADVVAYSDQGKLFSLIALIEGVTNLLASLLFNSVYPKTLHLFSGTVFLSVAVILLIPFGLLCFLRRYRRLETTET